MPQVIASWVERFATRLIQLQPDVRPLDAVRNATTVYAGAATLAPEVAAERFVSTAAGTRANAEAGPTQRRS